MASESGVIYIGVTNNLTRRVFEHKNYLISGFTQRYKCKKLVYFEQSNNIKSIISREKQLKNWRREKKVYLIEKNNPEWEDLSISLEMTTKNI